MARNENFHAEIIGSVFGGRMAEFAALDVVTKAATIGLSRIPARGSGSHARIDGSEIKRFQKLGANGRQQVLHERSERVSYSLPGFECDNDSPSAQG